MSNGASKEYKFGQKNNWRRTIWNEIAARVDKRKSAVCMYLAGAEDHDRAVAVSKGFDDRNLIAVEREQSVSSKLRGAGVLTVCADLSDALIAWPDGKRIDVIFGDLCGGLHDNFVTVLCGALQRQAFQKTIFAFNLLRGRDPFGAKAIALGRGIDANEKHRGRLLYRNVETILLCLVWNEIGKVEIASEKDLAEWNSWKARCREHLRPVFFSYKSGALVFDSVVFNGFHGENGFISGALKEKHAASKVRRRIAAVLAHRTMRIEKTGPYA